MSSPLSDDELSSILAGRWAIDCLRMTLHQQGTGVLRYSGPGSVRHGAHGGLEYVLYDTQAPAADLVHFGGTSGEWLEPENLFVLRGTDQFAREWTAEWISADTSSRFGEPGAVVYGGIRELTFDETLASDSSTALLHGSLPLEIPINARTEVSTSEGDRKTRAFSLDTWRSNTSLGEIALKKNGDILRARFDRSAPTLPTDISTRLEEALSFMLGTHVRWAVEQTLSDGTLRILLRSGVELPRRPRLRPPIETNQIDAMHDRAALLDRVLTYLNTTGAGLGEYHPLAEVLLRVLRASSTGIEDEALVLSTAVETVVKNHFAALSSPEDSVVADVDSALAYMCVWPRTTQILERIKSAIGQIKGANTTEALKKLEACGALRSGQTQNWRELRNPAAHGARSPHDIQGFVSRCDLVHDLLLRLVFRLVGYSGRYSNHTAKGWPLEAL